MIDYIKACDLAKEYLKNNLKQDGISKALEADECWIFYGGSSEVVQLGGVGISVSKKDGGIRKFILPSKENFVILKSSKQIEVPEEYKET